MSQNPSKTPDCKVCLVPHDPEIHEATLNLKRWFAHQVTKHFEDAEPVDDTPFAGTAA
jgi:hypothetical protein